MARAADGLTDKQRRFCEEYLVDCNGTKAAIRAGYSANAANREGVRLLSNAVVAETIAELRARQSKRTAITADTIMQGLYTEATREGKGSMHIARVTAWTTLAKILGMMNKKPDEPTVGTAELAEMFQAMVSSTTGSGGASGAATVAREQGKAQHRRRGP